MLSDLCLFGDGKGGGQLIAIFNDNITSGDPIPVKEYFFGAAESLSCDYNFLRAAGLASTWKKRTDNRFGSRSNRN